MKKTILEIYALAVCFATVVCGVVSLGVGVYDVIEIAAPSFTLSSHEHGRHQTNEAFFPDPEKQEQALRAVSEEEKTRRRLSSYAMALQAERRSGVQSLVIVSIILIIDAIVYLIHWRLARRAREAAMSTA